MNIDSLYDQIPFLYRYYISFVTLTFYYTTKKVP